MADEPHKFSFKPSKGEQPSENPLLRYYQKIQSFFASEQPPAHSLQGRIHEVEEECKELVEAISGLKDLSSKSFEPKLSGQLALVIDSLLKDLQRIQRESARSRDMAHHAKAGQKFQEWIDEARKLLSMKKEFGDPEKVLRYVVTYNVDEFSKRIDRDLQLIDDYLNHALIESSSQAEEVEEGEESAVEVNRGEVVKSLEPVLHKLQGLKNAAGMETIEQLAAWKLTADHTRGIQFGEALHIVDCAFHRTEFGHVSAAFLGENHAIEKRIGVLEEHVEQLKEVCEDVDTDFDDEENPYSNLAHQLEMEAREINRDPDIAPKEREKIQSIIKSLNIFRKEH